MPTNPKSIQILEATESVIARDGFANFTIDAVALEVGLSKGGVLHHFGSKDVLIRALVLRGAEQWKANCEEALEIVPDGPARFSRGILEFYLSDTKSWSNERKSVASAYLAALAMDPGLIEPIKAVSCKVHEQFLDNDIPRGLGLVIISALDGLWMSWALGLQEYDEERNTLLLQTLRLLVEDAIKKI
ncbi:MAG: TetR/AcrR family transcriptional regulator [Phycisphaerales bacterium]|nr:TetR/AcrR family transcriptional regulator [Phycisphaerales bacterium]